MVTRIGIAGTHSTGKTLLARRIEMELRATGLAVARTGGLAKRAAQLGFPKMTRHTSASTEWIISAGAAAVLEAERSADVVIMDRTPYDALAYYLAALQHRRELPDTADLVRLTALAELHTRHPVVLLATLLDPALPVHVQPAKDPDWQNQAFRTAVHEHLHQLLEDRAVEHLKVSSDGHANAVHAAVETITTRATS
ncbi:AAA family ATPase [Kitasatospora kifunensis]|uniref:Nicotinamide riboside kinase n=1 Tax=Kitasatospora kifunensis TaxID=58351 RepID=A0A7W7VT62_KITKI|nr:AAA family ATPase [Kitasatospora kifunensis]MBB4921344.1 nicotinamide riboside kinase [Kitasatospora kifunensis]